jgi:hypothetical protein
MRDVRYPGGYPGYLLDRHSYNASSSKELILLRATIILAMAARMGQATVRGEDSNAFSQYLASSAREINYAAADIYPVDGLTNAPCEVKRAPTQASSDQSPPPPPGPPATQKLEDCTAYRSNFESELPLLEAQLVKTVVAALPADKAREFLSAVTKGDIMGAAFKALGTFKTVAAGLHYANGSYRSGLEIVALQDSDCSKIFSELQEANKFTVKTAETCLKLPTENIFARTDKAVPKVGSVDSSAFRALMLIANSACTALPYIADLSKTGSDDLEGMQERQKACGAIWFQPKGRPLTATVSAAKPGAAQKAATNASQAANSR